VISAPTVPEGGVNAASARLSREICTLDALRPAGEYPPRTRPRAE
jgi:hypothetical protein